MSMIRWLLILLQVSICWAAADDLARNDDATVVCFDGLEREKARAFVFQTTHDVCEHAQTKLQEARDAGFAFSQGRWKIALSALSNSHIGSWSSKDEQLAITVYAHIVQTPAWKNYLKNPTSLPDWTVVYDSLVKQALKVQQAQIKGVKLRSTAWEDRDLRYDGYALQYNHIVLLAVYLLNETYLDAKHDALNRYAMNKKQAKGHEAS